MGLADTDPGNGTLSTSMNQSRPTARDGLPWYVRAAIAVVLLVILFVLAIDVLELLGAL